MRTVQSWTCELGYGADTMFHRMYFLFIITSKNLVRFSEFCYFTSTFPMQFCMYCFNILQLNLIVFLHYLVKLENYNCATFSSVFACETSQFILSDMWLSNSLGLNSNDYKVLKTMQQLWSMMSVNLTSDWMGCSKTVCYSWSYQWFPQTSASLCFC